MVLNRTPIRLHSFLMSMSSLSPVDVKLFKGSKAEIENFAQVVVTYYFMFSGRISRNIGENIFRAYTVTTSENTDFHVLVA